MGSEAAPLAVSDAGGHRPERAGRSGMWQRAQTFLFGDDIFISYSRADGATYAAGLGEALSGLGFSCKFDQWGTQPGKQLPASLTQALRRSAMLVLVGTHGAALSTHVVEEVRTFCVTGRPIIPVLFGDLVVNDEVLWQSDIEGLPISREDPETLNAGAPSAHVIHRVAKTFTFNTKERRLRRSAQVAASVFIVLVAASTGLGAFASWKAAGAVKAAAEAARQNDRAVAATNRARTQEARAQAESKRAADASARASSANEQRVVAESRTKDALEQEARARTEAQRQQEIARLRAVSNRVDADLSRDPTLLERSVLVNMEIVKRFQALGVPSVEADRGLRASLHLLPRFVSQLPELNGETELSPDGEFFANGWAWNTVFPVTVWQLATGEKVIESDHGSKRVNAIAFGLDERRHTRYLATACDDTFAGVWDLQSRKKVAWLKHAAPVRSVVFDGDATLMMTSATDQSLHVWRTSDWQEVAELHLQFVATALAFSPQAGTFAVADDKGDVEIWKSTDGAWAIAGRLAAQSEISRLLFSPDGTHLLVLKDHGEVSARLYDWPKASLVGQLQDETRQGELSVGADPERFYLAFRGNVRTLDWRSGKEGRLSTAAGAGGSFVSPDGRYFGILGDRVSAVRIQDTQNAQPVATIVHPADRFPRNSIFSHVQAVQAAGRHVLTLFGRRYAIWENPDSLPDRQYRHDHRVLWSSLMADGRLLGTVSVDGLLKVWDNRSGAELFSFMTPNDPIIEPEIKTVAFQPQGDLIAIVNWNDIFVVRRSTARVIAKLSFFEVYGLAFSPDGRYLAAGGSDGLVLWPTDSWTPIAVGKKAGHVVRVAFSPKGTFVATVTSQGDRVSVWRTRTGAPLGELKFDEHEAESVAFSPDEQLVALSIAGGARWQPLIAPPPAEQGDWSPEIGRLKARNPTVFVMKVATGKEVLRLRHGPTAASAIAFSPDGRALVTASGTVTALQADKVTVKVWRLSDGMEVASLDHSQSVETIGFSADRRLMVTGGRDSMTKVWDTRRWEQVAQLESVERVPFDSLSVGGKYVAALAADRSTQVWTLDVSDLLASACERVTRELTAEEWRTYFESEPRRAACQTESSQPRTSRSIAAKLGATKRLSW